MALASSTDVVRNESTGSTYSTLQEAVNAANSRDALTLLADVSLSQVVLTDPNLTFTVAPGITLTFTASNPSYSVRAVRNADGSISYTLVPVSPAPDPDDPLSTLDGDPDSYYEPLPDAGAKQLLQTGDHTPLALYLLLALACASVIAVMARRGRGRS